MGEICDNISGILVDHILHVSLKQSNVNPVSLTKYIDDVLALIKHTDIEEFLCNIHSTRIKFTYELEMENTLNFLDLTTVRKENRL